MDSYNNSYSNQYNNQYNGQYPNFNGAQEEKAPNIFVQFAYAFIPSKYNRLAKVKTGSMIGFVTLLVLIFTVLSFAELALMFQSMGGARGILDALPDFEIKNGELAIDTTYYIDEDDNFLYISDQIDEFSMSDLEELVDEGYNKIILISRTGIWSYSDNSYGRPIKFSDFDDISIDKDWIADTVMPIIGVSLAVIYVLAFVFGTLWYFACAAIYLLIAMLIAAIMNKKIAAGKLFRTAVYSKVFMYVIIKVLGFLPIASLSIPFLLRVVFTVIFLCFAVRFTDEPEQPAGPMTYGGFIQ